MFSTGFRFGLNKITAANEFIPAKLLEWFTALSIRLGKGFINSQNNTWQTLLWRAISGMYPYPLARNRLSRETGLKIQVMFLTSRFRAL